MGLVMGLNNINNINYHVADQVWTAWSTDGALTTWNWPMGNREDFWAFSIRSPMANLKLQILEQWTTYDNRENAVESFSVMATYTGSDPGNLSGGAALNFRAIQVD